MLNRIFELRIQKDMALDQLAEDSSTSKAELSMLERFDKYGLDPKLSTVCRISKALGFPAYYVFPCDQQGQDVALTQEE